MPNGEKAHDLVKAGFPQVSDLLDGVLVVVAFTLGRIIITDLLLVGLGRAAMRHKYYQTARNPRLDDMLRYV